MHNILIKIGRYNIVTLITLTSIIFSVIISFFLMNIFANGMNTMVLMISIFTPMIVAPITSWYIVGLVFRIHELERIQRNLATYDMLTGLLARRKFLEDSEELLMQMTKGKLPITLAYIDLDNFKCINDSHGHAGGDKVLKSFAGILKNHLRKSDLVGRIGGEEFAITFPNTNLDKSIQLLEEIRLSSENNNIEHSTGTIQYTVSIGVVQHHDTEQIDLDSLTRQSDIALYNAKKTGKNCIVDYQSMVANKC